MYAPLYEFRCFEEIPNEHKVLVLAKMLGALCLANYFYLKARPDTPKLYDAGIYYKLEPKGKDFWQDIPRTLELGNGDCEDLACWRVAELWIAGEKTAAPIIDTHLIPEKRFTLYHIRVRRADGSDEDPSCQLGMSSCSKERTIRGVMRPPANI